MMEGPGSGDNVKQAAKMEYVGRLMLNSMYLNVCKGMKPVFGLKDDDPELRENLNKNIKSHGFELYDSNAGVTLTCHSLTGAGPDFAELAAYLQGLRATSRETDGINNPLLDSIELADNDGPFGAIKQRALDIAEMLRNVDITYNGKQREVILPRY